MGSTLVCPIHQKPISQLCLSKEQTQTQRLFCNECETENLQITSLENGMKMWQSLENKMIQKFNNFKTQKISQLENMHKQFISYRETIMASTNKLLETTDDYKHQILRAIDREIYSIKELRENITIKKLQEIAIILSQKNEEEEDSNHVGNLNLEQILLREKQLFSKIKEQNQVIHQEIKAVVKQNKAEVKIKPINYSLKSSVKHLPDCYALTFSNTNKLLITGSGKDIIVWKFENEKLIQQQLLQGHSFNINCLCFSKHKNLFISGGCDSQIMIWQEISKEWKCQQILSEHSNSICNVILDRKDETIFSCSLDNSIKIWKRNEQEKYELKQSLNQHTGSVFSICLNDTEQQLISCGRDKQIIIWNLENEQWNKFQSFVNDDYGYRLCYISKICFLWSKYGNGASQIYLYDRLSQNYKLIKKINQKETNSDGYYLFPAIYNKKQLLIIQKHGRNIFIVRKLQNNKFSLLQTLEFNSSTIFGTISSDTEYLLIWTDKTKEIQIWKNE